jgi:hypothetical protein
MPVQANAGTPPAAARLQVPHKRQRTSKRAARATHRPSKSTPVRLKTARRKRFRSHHRLLPLRYLASAEQHELKRARWMQIRRKSRLPPQRTARRVAVTGEVKLRLILTMKCWKTWARVQELSAVIRAPKRQFQRRPGALQSFWTQTTVMTTRSHTVQWT